ncbi:hypothetical protein DFH09DRAFT_1081438 [Mycena vulgaris]|nr:hypothetical protein DFH09DRAFT_1096447 [Mycena vulgaris]KAJ6565780.1 hypothetical protein DFH09DRAFT_1081438 [Mycena vulgaris]
MTTKLMLFHLFHVKSSRVEYNFKSSRLGESRLDFSSLGNINPSLCQNLFKSRNQDEGAEAHYAEFAAQPAEYFDDADEGDGALKLSEYERKAEDEGALEVEGVLLALRTRALVEEYFGGEEEETSSDGEEGWKRVSAKSVPAVERIPSSAVLFLIERWARVGADDTSILAMDEHIPKKRGAGIGVHTLDFILVGQSSAQDLEFTSRDCRLRDLRCARPADGSNSAPPWDWEYNHATSPCEPEASTSPLLAPQTIYVSAARRNARPSALRFAQFQHGELKAPKPILRRRCFKICHPVVGHI